MIELVEIDETQWQLFRDLRLRALEEAPYAFGSTLAQWRDAHEVRWRERLATVPYNAVAYVEGKPAGMVSGIAPDESGTAELISMWVAPHARGTGAGDALVQAVIVWARNAGAERLALSVRERNAPAIALYRRNGFVETGEVFEEECRELRMACVVRLRGLASRDPCSR